MPLDAQEEWNYRPNRAPKMGRRISIQSLLGMARIFIYEHDR
jgi:hypothetical protein